jgi:hypothetical protein
MRRLFLISVFAAAPIAVLFARENVGVGKTQHSNNVVRKSAAGCQPATSQTDLNINNVRTTINKIYGQSPKKSLSLLVPLFRKYIVYKTKLYIYINFIIDT